MNSANVQFNRWGRAIGFCILSAVCWSAGAWGEIAVKAGQKIAFLGDSITAGGMSPAGYVSLVVAGL